jgi:hypothetical protein
MLIVFHKSQCTVSSNGLYTAGRLPAQTLRVFIVIIVVVVIVVVVIIIIIIIIVVLRIC